MCENNLNSIYRGPRGSYLESPKQAEWMQNFAFNPSILKWHREILFNFTVFLFEALKE